MVRLHENKVAIVTGAAGGLGFAVAKELLNQGAGVALVDQSAEGLEKVKDKIQCEIPGAEALYLTANVASEEDVRGFIKKTADHFGGIDYLHNNAGMKGPRKKITEYDSDDFNRVLDVNMYGVFFGMRYVLPVMKSGGGGSIVNTTSVYGLLGSRYQAGYIASKHAVSGLSKTAAAEFMPYGINVNAIAPVGIRTRMLTETLASMNPENPEKALEVFTKNNPSQRISKPEEIAGIVSFLFSTHARYINGQIITIDGGTSSQF